MHKSDKAPEPSMEEILASIRKIIAEEPVGSRPGLSRGSDEDDLSTALSPPSSDDESTHGPPYSVEEALADLMDDAPQRRTVRTGEREGEREPARKPEGAAALPSETAGHRPSWLFGRATGSPPDQQQGGVEPEAPRGPAGSLRGQLESLRSGPERGAGDGETADRKPGSARNPDDARSLLDRPRAGASPGLAGFPTPPPSQSHDLPRPAPQRVPMRDPSAAGLPGNHSGAEARLSKPAAGSGILETPQATDRPSESAPDAGPRAEAARKEPSTGPAAAPVAAPAPADQRHDEKGRDSKPVSSTIAGSSQPREAQPRAHVSQTAAPSAPPQSEPRPDARARPGEQSAAARTLEDTVSELLRPMLREWLDANMPRIVEKALRVELATLAKRPEADGNR